jgi:hypothetical protein
VAARGVKSGVYSGRQDMTMKRLAHFFVLAIVIVFCPCSSDAQQPGKVFRVGILALPPANTMQQRLGAFREALRDSDTRKDET